MVRRLIRLAPVAALLALSACSGAVLDPAGDIARGQRDIIVISTALMMLIIVPVMVLIVVFAWRYRKGSGATYDPRFDHSATLELVIWSAPLLIIIALGALTWSSTHLLDPFRPLAAKPGGPPAKPLVVQVVSLDWKWLFIYPEQGVATVNELVLPLDRPVRFDITSANMMNTFYAPTLAGMIYAMPGMQSQMHAILRRPGEYEGYSANYSGAGFSDMRFKLRGMTETDFARWVATAKDSGRGLSYDAYRLLVRPSEKVPQMRFAAVEPDLYRRILERCVEPGSLCMSETMMRDGMRGHSMPARGDTIPHAKPEGGLQQAPAEIDTVPHNSAPASPHHAPGATRPGSENNRSLS